jgi:hypothetical protein
MYTSTYTQIHKRAVHKKIPCSNSVSRHENQQYKIPISYPSGLSPCLSLLLLLLLPYQYKRAISASVSPSNLATQHLLPAPSPSRLFFLPALRVPIANADMIFLHRCQCSTMAWLSQASINGCSRSFDAALESEIPLRLIGALRLESRIAAWSTQENEEMHSSNNSPAVMMW